MGFKRRIDGSLGDRFARVRNGASKKCPHLRLAGRKLHRELNIPIGLVQSAWGGTPIETWISAERQKGDPQSKIRKGVYDNKARTYTPEKAQADFEKKLARWETQTAKSSKGGNKGRRQERPDSKSIL